jgi:3-deoxy-manno-octulosonate cytidylyltransferase (CMP-KDO synthetase)
MIVIPARLQSTRFPKKVLANINGLPMVIATAKAVQSLDDVLIATDSSEVVNVAKQYNFKAVLTSVNHQSGTDRINEAVQSLNLKNDEIIVNVQADEPFIELDVVQKVIENSKKIFSSSDEYLMTSCYKIISNQQAIDPNIVKVVTNKNNDALYFSRSIVPFDRDGKKEEYFGHLGIYGFSAKSLKKFCSYPPSPLENIEKLEQLRTLYNGKKISMVEVKSSSFGIDTKEDLAKALLVNRV